MFDQIIDRKNTGSYKYDGMKLLFERDDLMAHWVADMDFAVAPQILDALAKRLKHPIFGYNFVMDEFYESVSGWLLRRHNWDIKDQHIIAVPSLMTALAIAILTLTTEEDAILIQPPVYPPFSGTVKDHRRKLLTNPLINNKGYYEIDWQDFEAKAAKSKMFILCNPHNPVGRVFTEEELKRMNDICLEHKVIIFSDEIHADIVYKPHRHIPIGIWDNPYLISGISPAKSFNMAGLATAVMMTNNNEYNEKLSALNRGLHTFMGNSFGLAAFTAAYRDSEDWLNSLVEYLKGNRDFLLSYFKEHMPMIKVSPLEGSYLAWLDCRSMGLTDDELKSFFMDKAGLALNPGYSFGEEGKGFMRFNFACPRSVLERALSKIKTAMESL